MALDTTVGGASSDSYDTLAAYQAYGSDMGWTLAADAANEANLRRAAQVIDRQYAFKGYRASSTQALQWPRDINDLIEGYAVSSTTIPQAIIYAQFEMAYLIQNGADPFATIAGVVASTRSKAGPVETETTYQGGKGRASYVAISGLLAPYLTQGRGQRPMVRG
ncbi:hypothetical protein BV394_01980 [Brevirhabdus pacifica]|uniref:Uncharacterized protein n=1 Tax=Brevirhabdus pacifica TaxID=1267768 RepID=A0A1U7DF67_9RHOB|nr:DnaT-like ssDNA-binding protein [Brevirhabdus pacifica]APX88650.1 hypothetical protein BV394_01980 [Brevirhabdus pacifica]PJJ86849.1 hypothetical protein CLV77_1409 [Brevirhabdus pacifica]